MNDAQLEFADIENSFNFPEIDMDKFKQEYFEELIEDNIKEKEIDENIETKQECPKCGYKWS